MGGSSTADVIEATGTSTPAQGQGNRDERRKAAAAAKRAEKAAAKAAAAESTSTEETTEVTTDEAVPSKPAKAAFAVGRGARKVGQTILDANLRGAGRKVKGLKRFVPVVHIERRDESTEDVAPEE